VPPRLRRGAATVLRHRSGRGWSLDVTHLVVGVRIAPTTEGWERYAPPRERGTQPARSRRLLRPRGVLRVPRRRRGCRWPGPRIPARSRTGFPKARVHLRGPDLWPTSRGSKGHGARARTHVTPGFTGSRRPMSRDIVPTYLKTSFHVQLDLPWRLEAGPPVSKARPLYPRPQWTGASGSAN
jgi:hypothetical protein